MWCPLFLVYFLTITVRKKAGKNFIFCLVTWPKPETQRIFFLFSWFKSCHYVFPDKQFSTKGLFPLRLRIKYWFSPLSLRYHNDNLLTTIFWNFLSFFLGFYILYKYRCAVLCIFMLIAICHWLCLLSQKFNLSLAVLICNPAERAANQNFHNTFFTTLCAHLQ